MSIHCDDQSKVIYLPQMYRCIYDDTKICLGERANCCTKQSNCWNSIACLRAFHFLDSAYMTNRSRLQQFISRWHPILFTVPLPRTLWSMMSCAITGKTYRIIHPFSIKFIWIRNVWNSKRITVLQPHSPLILLTWLIS